MDIRIFSILILLLKPSDADCKRRMNTIFVYDEYVCKEKVVCDEFLKQIELIKTFARTPDMTDHFNPTTVICPGYHTRLVARYVSHGEFVKRLDEAVEDYFWSLPNLATTFAMIMPMVYKHGYHLPKSRRTVIIILTSTQDQRNLEMLHIFLREIAKYNGQVYAAGVGTDIEENVLQLLSSQPKKKNETYFLQLNTDILLRILRKERLETLYCSTIDYSIDILDTTQPLSSSDNSKLASGTTESQPSIKPSSATFSKLTSGTTEPQPSIKPSATFSSDSSTSVGLRISSEIENTKTSQRSRFKKSTLRSSEQFTTETSPVNDSSKYIGGIKDKIEPQFHARIWIEAKRLARKYSKYFMIGTLVGSIGAMALYWTYYPSQPKTKIGK